MTTPSISILYVGIGKYYSFFPSFYHSAEKYLCPNSEKYFYVYTDVDVSKEKYPNNVTFIFQKDLGWPGNTLMHFNMFINQKNIWGTNDFSIYFNGNALFLEPIHFYEIFSPKEHVITALTWHVYDKTEKNRLPYERRTESKAYIPLGKGDKYFQGGLFGAKTPAFIQLLEACDTAITVDNANGIIAVNHDESHLNRYLMDKEVLILTTRFGKPEEWDWPENPKILLRDKNKHLGTNFVDALKQRKKNSLFYRILRRLQKLF